MNWAAYLQANPDLAQIWAGMSAADKAQFQNDPSKFGEWHWNTRGQTENRPGGPPPAAAQPPGPQQVRDQIDAGPLAQFNREGLTTRNAYNQGQYQDDEEIAANAYNDLNAQALDAYGGRMGLLTDDYAQRRGFTDAEIAAWEARAATERARQENLVASRFGVRGDLGKSVRNIGEIGEQYAQDRALYEGGRRRADYEPYSSGRYQAYGDFAARQEGNLGDLWSNRANARSGYWNRAGSAYDQYQSGQGNAYSDWLNAYNRKSDMGYNASQLAVNAGQTATNNINTSTQNAADAYSNSQLVRGNANANMWNNIAYGVGNAYGSFKSPSSANKPNTYNAYGYQEDIHGWR